MEHFLIIQWYHLDGSKDGLPSPVGFASASTMKAFTGRLDRFNALYTVVNRADSDPTGEYDDSLSME